MHLDLVAQFTTGCTLWKYRYIAEKTVLAHTVQVRPMWHSTFSGRDQLQLRYTMRVALRCTTRMRRLFVGLFPILTVSLYALVAGADSPEGSFPWYFMVVDDTGKVNTNAIAYHLIAGGGNRLSVSVANASGVITLLPSTNSLGVLLRAGGTCTMVPRPQIRSGITNTVSLSENDSQSGMHIERVFTDRVTIGLASVRVQSCDIRRRPSLVGESIGQLNTRDPEGSIYALGSSIRRPVKRQKPLH